MFKGTEIFLSARCIIRCICPAPAPMRAVVSFALSVHALDSYPTIVLTKRSRTAQPWPATWPTDPIPYTAAPLDVSWRVTQMRNSAAQMGVPEKVEQQRK